MRSFEKVSYSENLRKLQEFRDWLIQHRIPTAKSRFESIIINMEDINEHYETHLLNELIKDKGNVHLWYTLMESSAYITVYEMMKSLEDHRIPKRAIRNALEGPFLPMDEHSGDKNVNPRNHLFELELAGKLYKKNFKTVGFEDVQFTFDNYYFHVQCKRLFSKKNISHNIISAHKQLSTDIRTTNSRGIIALAIEKILDVDGKMLLVDKVDDIGPKISALTNSFINTYSSCWTENVIHPKVIGIILITRFIAQIRDINLLTSCSQMDVISLCSKGNLQIIDTQIMRDVGAQLKL